MALRSWAWWRVFDSAQLRRISAQNALRYRFVTQTCLVRADPACLFQPCSIFDLDTRKPMKNLQLKIAQTALAVAISITIPSSQAAAPAWRVVLGSQTTTFILPGLPATNVGINRPGPELSAGGKLGAILTIASDPNEQLWTELANGSNAAIARNLTSGATGPNRSGAEANHQFDSIYAPAQGNPGDVQFFRARASDPLNTATRSVGIWRNANGVNTEFARLESDGALGPNLGAGFSYRNNPPPNLHALADGSLIVDGLIVGGDSLEVIARHTGTGPAQPCSVAGSSNPAYAPGMFPAPDRFTTYQAVASSQQSEVYAAATAQAVSGGPRSEGLFRFCQGAPIKLALQSAVNDFGPGLGAAFFTGFHKTIAPGNAGAVFYGAEGRYSGAVDAGTFKGLFFHDGTRTKTLALQGAEGQYGPNVPGYRFVNTSQLTEFGDWAPQAAGNFALITARIETIAGTDEREGLWRVSAAGQIDRLAILNDAAFAPQPGWIFSAFALTSVFANGDVSLLAEIQNLSTNVREIGLWRLRPNRIPERLLGPGSIVQASSSGGGQSIPVIEVLRRTALVRPLDGLEQDFTGDDHWTSPDGQALVAVVIAEPGGSNRLVFVRAALFNPDINFQDGFE